MPIGLGVSIEIELYAGEQGRGLEVAGELVVRQGIDESHRLRTIGLGTLGCPDHRIRERERGERCRGQRPVPEASRRVHRALGRFVNSLVPRAPDLVLGKLDHERHSLG